MRKRVHYLWIPTNQDDIICPWVLVESVEGTKHFPHANRAAGHSKLMWCNTGITTNYDVAPISSNMGPRRYFRA